MMGKVIGTEEFSEVIKRFAESRARDRARSARWDLDVAVFYFSIMFLVIILVYLDIVIEIVAPVAIAGLVIGWLIGWKKGRQKFQGFYDEELLKVQLELEHMSNRIIDVTLKEQVLKKQHKKKGRRKNAS